MNNKREKILWMLIVTVGVVTASLGFAAFTGSLTINLSASVDPDDTNFGKTLKFSSITTSASDTETLTPTSYSDNVTVGTATIDNTGAVPLMSNSGVVFNNPGDYIEYTFYILNVGNYDVYLTKLNFLKFGDSNSFITCTANEGTDATLVSDACSSMHVSVKIADEDAYTTTSTYSDHLILKNTYNKVILKIYYDADATIVDGGFDVSMGDITILYSTVDSN